jgi:hypothetical protein
MQTDGRTVRRDEANSDFPQISERAYRRTPYLDHILPSVCLSVCYLVSALKPFVDLL